MAQGFGFPWSEYRAALYFLPVEGRHNGIGSGSSRARGHRAARPRRSEFAGVRKREIEQ